MRIFHCDHCKAAIFFENTFCTNCGHQLAYLPDIKILASLDEVKGKELSDRHTQARLWSTPVSRARDRTYRFCENDTRHSVCNWAIPSADPNPLCQSCRLTRVIPDLAHAENCSAWRALEMAKRRLIYSLNEFELPILSKTQDAVKGLAFEFLGDQPGKPVLTGHNDGVIVVNIAEANDAEREKRRLAMHEPYRTLLGHFRHEIGHYYWDLLIKDSTRLQAYRDLFGDERADYDQALRDHYANGPKPNWRLSFVTEYAAVHPWEDWAETWAHYLHMTDTLETAAVCGLSLDPDRTDEPSMKKQPRQPVNKQPFDQIINNWFPLTYVLNSLNRGMGMADAYPFVLPTPTIDKLRFIHETICQCAQPAPPAPAKEARMAAAGAA